MRTVKLNFDLFYSSSEKTSSKECHYYYFCNLFSVHQSATGQRLQMSISICGSTTRAHLHLHKSKNLCPFMDIHCAIQKSIYDHSLCSS